MNKSISRQKVQSLLAMSEITEPPVDVERIAEDLGFMIVPYDFPDKRRGVIHIDGTDKAIGINENQSKQMQRFTIAHELGHFLYGHQHYEKTFVDDESRFKSPHFHQEREADIFAAELLMPREWLEQDVAQIGLKAEELAEKYNVSEQAMWIRLTSTGIAEKYPRKK